MQIVGFLMRRSLCRIKINTAVVRVAFVFGWLPCWERASHLALQVSFRKMFYGVFFFPPGVYVGALNYGLINRFLVPLFSLS